MYSRRLRVEEKENKKKATGFILLTLAAIGFMFFYGIPLLAKISNFAYDLKKGGEQIESSDRTPPPPPRFSDIPAFTNNEKLEINGNTESASNVTITLNGKSMDILANNEGGFSQTVSLWDGENTLFAFATDSAGNRSLDSETYIITLDEKPPDLDVTNPKEGDTFYGAKNRQITVSGTTEKDAQVQINDHLAIVDSSGNFSTAISLNEGENAITVKSQDLAGNVKEVKIAVKYTR